jgi:hypothetical protein
MVTSVQTTRAAFSEAHFRYIPRMTFSSGRFVFLLALGCTVVRVHGQDTAGLGGATGKQPVALEPTTRPAVSTRTDTSIDMNGWTYRAVKSPRPAGGVPWELIVTPTAPLPEGWRKGVGLEAAGFSIGPGQGDVRLRAQPMNSPVPIVEMPEELWKQWMASDLREAVGVHFHEVVTNDVARLLLTVHRVDSGEPPPLDAPLRGKEPPDPPAPRGTRLEATLLAPVMFSLDQSIAVRKHARRPERAAVRGAHELGHAEVSQKVFFATLSGPQDWKPQYCTGRRSRIEYYWNREKIGRTWEGHRRGVGELATLRTSVVLVPPTRWSMMLPVPPERVTQKQIQDFNDAIVRVSPLFNAADAAAQEHYHALHGAYEEADGP